jgi:hypothetical protein
VTGHATPGAASIVLALALTFAIAGFAPAITANQTGGRSEDNGERHDRDDDERKHRKGQAIFRYDTFGDEQLWTDVLRMHDQLFGLNLTAPHKADLVEFLKSL